MPPTYFSDRERGAKPRTLEEIGPGPWGGIISLVDSRIADGSFGLHYPEQCPDGTVICGTNYTAFTQRVVADIPELRWPLRVDLLPPILAILDLIEFCHRAVAKPIQGSYHGYHSHHHLTFDEPTGKVAFREDVNNIFARNEIAYELRSDGLIGRLGPEGLREPLSAAVFRTGDSELDAMLETARAKFLNPDLRVRKEALEKLWDAWERIKTIEVPGADKKKESIARLLGRASREPRFRSFLDSEAMALTEAGNSFQIRHSETHQIPLEEAEHVDYMFHRMFALIRLLLRQSGRGG